MYLLDQKKVEGLYTIGTDLGPCEGECRKKDQRLFILRNGDHLCGDCFWKKISAAKVLRKMGTLGLRDFGLTKILSPMPESLRPQVWR